MSTAGDDRPGAIGGVSSGETAKRSHLTGRRSRRVVIMAAVAGFVVAADQVTKSLAVARLSSGPIHLIGPFQLALSYNSGVAFSIGRGLSWPIAVLAVVLVLVVAWFGRTVPNTTAAVAVGMILGGALGNLADRLFRGHHGQVIDFIYSGFWPTFNLADSSIVCGSVLLGIVLWRSSSTKRPPEARRRAT